LMKRDLIEKYFPRQPLAAKPTENAA